MRSIESRTTCRVLVIDADTDARLLLRMLIQVEHRMEIVGEAGDGASGILLATDCRPDVIVLDAALPVMDGLAALPDLRRAAPHAAIAVWTASTIDDRLEQQAFKLGADAVIDKAPREPPVVMEFISAHADGKR